MKVNLNLSNNQQSFQAIKLEKTSELARKMSMMPSSKRELFNDTFNILEKELSKRSENDKYIIDAMHPAKAGYVKTSSYSVLITEGNKKPYKQTYPIYSMEDISLRINDNPKSAGFFMNPDEPANRLANWLLETFDKLKSKLG